MPYSYDVAVASGATAVFGVPFPYLQKEHVHVSVDGSLIPDNQLVWLSANSLQLPSNPANGAKVRRYRSTPAQTSPVTFTPGFINAADLNTYVTHMLYVVQEAFDAGAEGYQITEQILSYLDNLGTMLEQAQEASEAAVAANVLVQEALAVVQQLRDEVQAIVDLNALGVTLEPEDWITATNVQAGFEQIAAAVSALDTRVDAVEAAVADLPTTLAAKYDKAGGTITGNARVNGNVSVGGTISTDALGEIGARIDTRAATYAAAAQSAAISSAYSSAASLASSAQSTAIASAASTALGYANARVSAVALGGSWSSTRPAGGVITSIDFGGPNFGGKYLYYYIPSTGWVAAGDV